MPIFNRKKTAPGLDGLGLEELLFVADTQEDPKLAHAALIKAESLRPDSLEVQRRLLLHGRLHERDPKRLDFSVIKCYLLHAFEHPEQHPEEDQRRMARELFDAPRLLRCLELANYPQAFLEQYLKQLSHDYLRIFIAPDRSHSPRLLGFSLGGKLNQYLARPARDVLANALSSPHLSAGEAKTLAAAFYTAFNEYNRGDAGELDRLLGAELRAQLMK